MKALQKIEDALAPIVPAYHGNADESTPTTYVTYFMYDEQPESFAENKPIAIGSYWQFDLWRLFGDDSGISLNDIKEEIKTALEKIGFQGFTAQEIYEKDTGINHVALRCNYIE